MVILRQDISICIFLVLFTGLSLILSSQFKQIGLNADNTSWLTRLLANLLGYSVVLLPGYIVLKYVRRANYIDTARKGCLWPIIRECVYGQESEIDLDESVNNRRTEPTVLHTSFTSYAKSGIALIYCFAGLQASYLTWGYLQEKIITQAYGEHKFTDSQFLVFVNRIFGLILAFGYITFFEGRGTYPKAPLYKYSFCAFSNIMSSWFQYEALKFVSFPTQVLAKASKIIPVMLMGKLVSRKSYEFYEYFTAALISFGMVLFLFGSNDYLQTGNPSSTASVGLSGLIILILYMAFDSFTSNWQSELFRVYKMSAFRMMAGVNLFSLLLTGVSLIQQGGFAQNFDFLLKESEFAFDVLLLSLCSAIGQLFIYFTIEKFGPVVFIIIMSIRQAIAVVISCILFHHPISVLGVVGVLIIFCSIFLRTYCSYRLKQLKAKPGQTKILLPDPILKL